MYAELSRPSHETQCSSDHRTPAGGVTLSCSYNQLAADTRSTTEQLCVSCSSHRVRCVYSITLLVVEKGSQEKELATVTLRWSIRVHIKEAGFPIHEAIFLYRTDNPCRQQDIKAVLFVPHLV